MSNCTREPFVSWARYHKPGFERWDWSYWTRNFCNSLREKRVRDTEFAPEKEPDPKLSWPICYFWPSTSLNCRPSHSPHPTLVIKSTREVRTNSLHSQISRSLELVASNRPPSRQSACPRLCLLSITTAWFYLKEEHRQRLVTGCRCNFAIFTRCIASAKLGPSSYWIWVSEVRKAFDPRRPDVLVVTSVRKLF